MFATDIRETLPIIDIELQLFATTNLTTDTQATTGNELSPEMKTYYERELLDNAEPNLVHDQFGDEYPIPKNGGKNIEFRRFSPLPKALKPLTEGVTPVGKKLNVSILTATVKQYGDYVEQSDMLEFTAIDRTVEVATMLLGSQAGRTLDTITREVLNGGTNKMFAPKIVGGVETPVLLRKDIDTSALFTPSLSRLAVNQLKRMNAMSFDGDFIGVIHPDTECDIMGSDEWQKAHEYCRPENIYEGEIGKLYGVRYVSTTEAKIIGPEYIFGSAETGGVCRMTLHTALDGNGSVNIFPAESITAAQAAELTARIAAAAAAGEVIKIYVGGKEATLASVTAGEPGTGKFVVTAAVQSVEAGAVICGVGAGKDGSAVYSTLILARNAFGKTQISGMGLEHIVKQRGSSGTADPLNQRSTVGWKATKVTERLVEEFMIRVEHSSHYGHLATSN